MKLSALAAEARRLSLALGGEAMQSGLHFVLNLALVALLPSQDYGVFAFTLVIGGVAITYVRAATAMPASIYIGRARSPAFAAFCEGAFGAAAVALCLVMGLVAFAALSRFAVGSPIAGALVVALWSLRSHARTVGFASGQPGAVTLGDAAFAIVGAGASAVALAFPSARLEGALIALALANAVGLVAIFAARRATPRADLGRRSRRFYFGLSRRLVWSLYSVTAGNLQGQGLSILVVSTAGPAGYAPIAAMLAFFAPLRVFALSLANLLQPEASRLAARGDEAGWRALRRTWTLRCATIALLYGDLALILLPRLPLRSIQGQPVLFVAICAFVIYAVVLVNLPPRLLMEARMRFREIAGVTTLGALVGLAVSAIFLRAGGVSASLAGTALGETLIAAAIWRLAAAPLTRGEPKPELHGQLEPTI